MATDVFNITEGVIVIQWPDKMSRQSLDDFKSLLRLVERRALRSSFDGGQKELPLIFSQSANGKEGE